MLRAAAAQAARQHEIVIRNGPFIHKTLKCIKENIPLHKNTFFIDKHTVQYYKLNLTV